MKCWKLAKCQNYLFIYTVCINLKQITIICTDCTIELSLGSLPGFSVETVFLAINFYYPEIHNNYIAKLPKHQTVYFNQNHSSFNWIPFCPQKSIRSAYTYIYNYSIIQWYKNINKLLKVIKFGLSLHHQDLHRWTL